MKAKGLEGEYCPTCASALSNPHRVIVLCGSVCGSVFQESGDADRLENSIIDLEEAEAKRLADLHAYEKKDKVKAKRKKK